MSTEIRLTTGTTIINTASSEICKFLVCDINNRNVAIPLYQFPNSYPPIDLVMPKTDLVLKNATFVNDASSYWAGIAINLWETSGCTPSAVSSQFCFPIYKMEQTSTIPALQVVSASIVADLSATSQYLIANINDEPYAIPLFNYGTEYPFTTPLTSAFSVNTWFEVNPTQYDTSRDAGSTNLNPKIKTYADLIRRIKMQLGWPVVQVEGCDEQIVDFIDQAIEWYTKYAGYTEEFLVFDSNLYKPGIGIKMDDVFSRLYCMQQNEPRLSRDAAKHSEHASYLTDYDLDSYRKVVNVFSWDEGGQNGGDFLFSMEYIFAQQTYFSYVLGNYGFDLVSWHILKDWIDTRERMFALTRRFDFNERTQMLRLLPEPTTGQRFVGIIGAYVEKPIKDLIMERWIYKYALALTKIQVGNVRGKFGAVQLFGGGTVSIEIGAQGLAEQEKLEAELMDGHGEVPPNKFFIG